MFVFFNWQAFNLLFVNLPLLSVLCRALPCPRFKSEREHQGALVHPMLLARFGVNARTEEVRAQMSDKTEKLETGQCSCAFSIIPAVYSLGWVKGHGLFKMLYLVDLQHHPWVDAVRLGAVCFTTVTWACVWRVGLVPLKHCFHCSVLLLQLDVNSDIQKWAIMNSGKQQLVAGWQLLHLE